MGKVFRRVIWIVIDSVGIGALEDAADFGDETADTLGHIFQHYKDISLPNMSSLGLNCIDDTTLPRSSVEPKGVYCKSREKSNGKDTTTGHWEMIGVVTKKPFKTFPDGFPKEIIDEFIRRTGVEGVLGNCVASGTEIIKQLGDEHVSTKYPIIYTSADSVFQIACHDDVYSNDELYRMCVVAREILMGENSVARVIARPFTGKCPFERTAARRDYSLKPDDNNLLVKMKKAGMNVAGIGKIEDIFAKSGMTDAVHTKDNNDGMDKIFMYMDKYKEGLIFTNLVEFDSKWGHRRDVYGYARGLNEFDVRLGELIEKLDDEDLLIVNADHGCDPTYKGTDHTREYIPVLMYSKKMKKGKNLHILDTFADIGQTIADNFEIDELPDGKSFLESLEEVL